MAYIHTWIRHGLQFAIEHGHVDILDVLFLSMIFVVMFMDLPVKVMLVYQRVASKTWELERVETLETGASQISSAATQSGWWFGTFFIFPYIGNNHPN